MDMASVTETYLENRWEVQPNHANNFQSAHGGNVMKWMDGLGGLSAMRFAGNTCVTARMGAIEFEGPIPTGETVLVKSWVFDTGTTSIDVRLETYRENPLSGETGLVSETFATYVAIDEEKNPVDVPDLAVDSPEGRRLVDAAIDARQESNG
jgi:acyl-CoA hydrolase